MCAGEGVEYAGRIRGNFGEIFIFWPGGEKGGGGVNV
jgi:hypothetical protein